MAKQSTSRKCFFLFVFLTSSLGDSRNLITHLYNRLCTPALLGLPALPKAERWQVDGPHSDYTIPFKTFLEAEGIDVDKFYFDKALQERKKRGITTHFMDLFGSGFNIQDRSLATSMLGVRKGPIQLDPAEIAAGITVPPQLFGDLLDPKTWVYIDKHLKKNNAASFDLVTMLPEGGWVKVASTAEENDKAISYITEQVVKRLSPLGEFYFSIDHPHTKKKLEEEPHFQKVIQQIHNLKPPKEIIYRQIASSRGTGYFSTMVWIKPQVYR